MLKHRSAHLPGFVTHKVDSRCIVLDVVESIAMVHTQVDTWITKRRKLSCATNTLGKETIPNHTAFSNTAYRSMCVSWRNFCLARLGTQCIQYKA